MKKSLVVILLLMFAWHTGFAQMQGGSIVQVSHNTQMMNGRLYFVHVVEQGQTVYAISRAYGLKEVEAITKKDVHFLQIGDTVWLPCKGQKLSDGTTAPTANAKPKPTTSNASKTGKASQQGTTANNAGQPLSAPAVVRPRVNPQSIVVSLMMPFNLSQLDKISTSKFDVEQRGRISYQCFDFIQFYEGLLLGLDRLEKMGYDVTLNVVDVEGTSDEEVEKAFRSHNVAQSDLLIAMMTRLPFAKVAELAREAHLFVVNPVADRSEIVVGNPYVFKCLPSNEAKANSIVRVVRRTMPNMPIYIVHSNAKSEKPMLDALTDELGKHDDMQYTLVDWAQQTKLTTALRGGDRAVVISLYNQDKSKNRIFSSQLLNKLSAFKNKLPYLITVEDWCDLYNDVDFSQLQGVNYHTFYADWNLRDVQQKAFIDLFHEKYKTEPTNVYAGMAHDIILYFVSGIEQKGTNFFQSPSIVAPQGMLYPLNFSHSRSDYGFENQQAIIYRMNDYHFDPIP